MGTLPRSGVALMFDLGIGKRTVGDNMTANGYGIKEVDLSKKATLNKSAGFVASEKCVASSKEYFH